MDTPGMKDSCVGLASAHPRDHPAVSREARPAGHPVTKVNDARVGYVAKKGRALYHEDLVGTMSYAAPTPACLKAPRPHFASHASHHQDPRGTGEDAHRRAPRRAGARHDR